MSAQLGPMACPTCSQVAHPGGECGKNPELAALAAPGASDHDQLTGIAVALAAEGWAAREGETTAKVVARVVEVAAGQAGRLDEAQAQITRQCIEIEKLTAERADLQAERRDLMADLDAAKAAAVAVYRAGGLRAQREAAEAEAKRLQDLEQQVRDLDPNEIPF